MAEMSMMSTPPELIANAMTTNANGKSAKKSDAKQNSEFGALLSLAFDQSKTTTNMSDSQGNQQGINESILSFLGLPGMAMITGFPIVATNEQVQSESNTTTSVQLIHPKNNQLVSTTVSTSAVLTLPSSLVVDTASNLAPVMATGDTVQAPASAAMPIDSSLDKQAQPVAVARTANLSLSQVSSQPVSNTLLAASMISEKGIWQPTTMADELLLQPVTIQPEQSPEALANQATRNVQPASSHPIITPTTHNMITGSFVITDPAARTASFSQPFPNGKTSMDQKQRSLSTGVVVESQLVGALATVVQTENSIKPIEDTQVLRTAANVEEASVAPLVFMMDEPLGKQHDLNYNELGQGTEHSAQLSGYIEAVADTIRLDSVAGTNKTTATPMQDTHDIMTQIVEQARMVNRVNNSEMVVKLKPEHLGELTLKVTVESGVVSASFHSNNQEVRAVLEASLPQLKQELSNQGLKVEYVGVYAGLNQFFSNQQQQAAPQQFLRTKNRKTDEQRFEEIAEAVSAISAQNTDGVDYRI